MTMSNPYRAHLLADDDVLRLVPVPRASRVALRLLAVSTLLVAAALAFVPWQQSASARGKVIAFAAEEREQMIDAPVEGRVLVWRVQEGQRVRRGDTIAELGDNDPDIVMRIEQERASIVSRVAAAKGRVTALDARIASLEISKKNAVAAADERVRMAQQRIRASNDALEATLGAEGTAAIQEKRIKSLESEGIQSKRAAELAELDALRAKTEVGRARAALAGSRAEELAFKADRIKVESDASAGIADATASRASALAEIASGEAEIARIDVRLARQRAQDVKAPRDGLLRRILVREGVELVKGGDPIAILVPDTEDRAVEMWVDGLDVNLVHPGRRVRLAFEGWPALQFSGWPQAMVGTYGGIVAFVDAASEGPEGRFRVVVRPDPSDVPWPDSEYLRQGMRASGWVLLDRVRLGYELWRQLNDFPPDWPTDAPRPAKNGDKKAGEKK